MSFRTAHAFNAAAHAFTHLFVLLYATAVLAIERAWNLPFADLAWLSLPGFVLFGLGALPAGWLGDRWSARGMMAVFFIGLGGASVLTGLAEGPTGLMVGLTLIGLFASIYHPVGIAWLVRIAANRGRALGINGIFGSLGTAAASLVAAALADAYGWRAAFIVPGLVVMLVGAAFVVACRLGYVVDTQADVKPTPQASGADVRRAFWVLSATMLMTGMIFQSTSVALPKLFEEEAAGLAGGSMTVVGVMVSLVYLVSAFAQLVGGELADRWSERGTYVLVLFAQVPVIVLAAFAGDALLVVLAGLMVSLSLAGQPSENALLARYTPARWRSRAFGAKFVLTFGVSTIGVALVPLIHDLTGSMVPLLWVLALAAALAGVAALAMPGRSGAPASTLAGPDATLVPGE